MKGRIYKGKQHRYYIVIEGEEPVSTVFSRSCYQIENFSLKFLKEQSHLELNDWKCEFEIVKKDGQSFAKVSAICPPNEELEERDLSRTSDNSAEVVGTFCKTCRQVGCICDGYEMGIEVPQFHLKLGQITNPADFLFPTPINTEPTIGEGLPRFSELSDEQKKKWAEIKSEQDFDFFKQRLMFASIRPVTVEPITLSIYPAKKLTASEKLWLWLHEPTNIYNEEIQKEENLYTPDCIRTYTGKYINVFEPTLEMINIVDIAHALAHVPRFGGHTAKFYSVAQHSIAVAMKLPPEQQLAGLLHDATEAYLCDMPSPIKNRMPEYKKIEDKLMVAIARKFGITYPFMQVLKDADKAMLETEWNCIVLNREPFEFKHLSPAEAKKQFLELFEFLTTKIK